MKQDDKPEEPEEPEDFRDAVLIAMLEHPEHAEEIAQWASEHGEDSLNDSLEESIFESVWNELFEDHGPPPSPGLVFDETSHRWVRPTAGDSSASPSSAPKSQADTLQAIASELGDEAKKPGMLAKIKGAFAKAWDAVHVAAISIGHKLNDLAPDILDVAADYSKIFYAGRGDSNQNTPDPFMNSLGVGSSTVAVIASHILGRASVWIRSKLAGRKQEAVAGTLSIEQRSKAVADLLNGINESLGSKETVDAAEVESWMNSKEGAK